MIYCTLSLQNSFLCTMWSYVGGRLGRKWRQSAGFHHCEREKRATFPGIFLFPRCTSGFLSVSFRFTGEWARDGAALGESYLKVLHPRLPHTPSAPHPWHVGPAVERVIATPCPMLESTPRPNRPCHRPLLAVKYWMWHHRLSWRGTEGLEEGVGCMRHDKTGGEAARNVVSVEAITSNSPGGHLKL